MSNSAENILDRDHSFGLLD